MTDADRELLERAELRERERQEYWQSTFGTSLGVTMHGELTALCRRLATENEELRNATLEEAAKVCKAGYDHGDYTNDHVSIQAHMQGWNSACSHRADAIRALKSTNRKAGDS